MGDFGTGFSIRSGMTKMTLVNHRETLRLRTQGLIEVLGPLILRQ